VGGVKEGRRKPWVSEGKSAWLDLGSQLIHGAVQVIFTWKNPSRRTMGARDKLERGGREREKERMSVCIAFARQLPRNSAVLHELKFNQAWWKIIPAVHI
jgi:hypothetical protein